MNNNMEVRFKSFSENEAFARVCVASFCLQLNPTLDELTDIKTAVSEAVTNSVVHAYPDSIGDICVKVEIFGQFVRIEVSDFGIGIDDIEKAREPFFTTKAGDDRSGMGFAVMESFMDKLLVERNSKGGICVVMEKNIKESVMVAGDEC